MKRYFIMFFIVLGIVGCVTHYDDAAYESSDGLWKDRTVEIKGRDFLQVLFFFETYRLKANKTDVKLLRITQKPKKVDPNDPKWKVPYAKSSGRAKTWFLDCSPEELKEIKTRAEKALEYWKNQ